MIGLPSLHPNNQSIVGLPHLPQQGATNYTTQEEVADHQTNSMTGAPLYEFELDPNILEEILDL
eukprot:CAMPEP_0184339308 /NCGR_PEP_ID=MMETSP1089-20130417/7980_1 /TAXON_ID=38269 ORGANISM="Gloeochaete wittrockiana, Strain SAG46.84" /NCGR_SAMPLE_ID=MMETSP1089 /ASSEMBLY_ACC=CAM_ASM_000445 /LENGTH=63 /DNA_ID=CAMNT_0026666477 /DNA_START=90 /DNA_END=281 /DNA_ORIENTATION=+